MPFCFKEKMTASKHKFIHTKAEGFSCRQEKTKPNQAHKHQCPSLLWLSSCLHCRDRSIKTLELFRKLIQKSRGLRPKCKLHAIYLQIFFSLINSFKIQDQTKNNNMNSEEFLCQWKQSQAWYSHVCFLLSRLFCDSVYNGVIKIQLIWKTCKTIWRREKKN